MTCLVVYNLFENVETLIFKCRLSKGTKHHCSNWDTNFNAAQEPETELNELYRDGEPLGNLSYKAHVLLKQEAIHFNILQITLSVLVCYYLRKM